MSSPFSSGIGVTRPARNPAAQGNVKFEGSLRKRQARRPLSEGGPVFERSPLHVRATPVRCSDFPEPVSEPRQAHVRDTDYTTKWRWRPARPSHSLFSLRTKQIAYSLSCTRTVAEAVTVLMPVKDDDPPFRTTISVTVSGIPPFPAVTVT